MKKHTVLALILTAFLCAGGLVSCDSAGATDTDTSLSSPSSSVQQTMPVSIPEYPSTTDTVSSGYQSEDMGAQYLTLSGVRDVKITEPGTYVLTGTLTDGQLLVNVGKEYDVTLVFDGVEITNNDSAAVYIQKANTATIILPDGSVNILNDGDEYVYENAESDEPNAALFCKNALIIEGDGTLFVNANYNNGITSRDILRVTGGILYVTAADDGMMGRDGIEISGGTITVCAAGDGIKTTNTDDPAYGNIMISDGDFSISAGSDCVASVNRVDISGGTFILLAADGSTGTERVSQEISGFWGRVFSEGTETADDSVSAKGIKADDTITISGGTFSIDAANDAIHSNTHITLSGGEFTISTDDDGIHADGDLVISNGTITILHSYESIEATDITIDGGILSIVSTDDGINAAGGTDSTSAVSPSGTQTKDIRGFRDSFLSASSGTLIINGGTISVNAAGDGIDVNGSAAINGGEVYVYGPTDTGNGAIDYDGSFATNIGCIAAVLGSSGMAQSFSQDSSQPSVMLYLSNMEAGTVLALTDASGNELFSITAEKVFSSVALTHPLLTLGESYRITVNGENYVSFSLSSTVTSISGDDVEASYGLGNKFPNGFDNGTRPGKNIPPDGVFPDMGEMPEIKDV